VHQCPVVVRAPALGNPGLGTVSHSVMKDVGAAAHRPQGLDDEQQRQHQVEDYSGLGKQRADHRGQRRQRNARPALPHQPSQIGRIEPTEFVRPCNVADQQAAHQPRKREVRPEHHHGDALAGGCELALVADLIVASNESEFGIPEAKRGLVAAAGGVLRLSQRLPRNIAMELALTGKPMSAVRLAELGLVNRLADPGKVLDAALELAAEIVVNAPLSLQASKQIIDGARDWSTTEEFQNQTDIAAVALFSEDAQEGVAAFAQHRDAVWTGR